MTSCRLGQVRQPWRQEVLGEVRGDNSHLSLLHPRCSLKDFCTTATSEDRDRVSLESRRKVFLMSCLLMLLLIINIIKISIGHICLQLTVEFWVPRDQVFWGAYITASVAYSWAAHHHTWGLRELNFRLLLCHKAWSLSLWSWDPALPVSIHETEVLIC